MTAGESDPNEANRLWSHALHLNSEVVQRGSFYLIGESMLVVAFSAILSAEPASIGNRTMLISVAFTIAAFGIVLAGVWWYTGHKHWRYLRHLRERALATLPEYRRTWELRPKSKFLTGALHTYVVPVIAALMWLILVVVLIR